MDRIHTNTEKSLSRGAVGRLLFLMAAIVLFLIAARPVLAGEDAGEGAGQQDAENVTKVTPTESVDLYDTSRMPRKIRKVVFRAANYGRRGDFAKAVEVLEDHLAKHPDQDHYLVQLHLAQNLADDGATDDAYDHYQQALVLEPNLDRAWFGLADTAYELERFEVAGDAFLSGYDHSPERPVEVLYFAGVSFLSADLPEKALAVLDDLTSGRYGVPQLPWYQALVAAAVKAGQPETASPRIAEMLEYYPDDPEAWFLKYQYHASARDFQAAAVALAIVGYMRPLSETEHQQLGDLYTVLQVPHMASRNYAAGMGEEQTAEEFERLVSSLVAAHELDEALEVLEKVLAADPTPRLLSLLGDIHYLRKDYEKASEAYGDLLEVDPESGRAWLMMGYCALEMGKKEEALDNLAKASSFADQSDMAQILMQRALRM
jgi:tetratricopeptide (TPR) repeat protein